MSSYQSEIKLTGVMMSDLKNKPKFEFELLTPGKPELKKEGLGDFSLAESLIERILETSKFAGNTQDVSLLVGEIRRLKAGRFNSVEFQNLCHTNVEEACPFAEGCVEYNYKLFGEKSRLRMDMQMFNVVLENKDGSHSSGKVPVRSTENAAGYDLFAAHEGVINPLEKVQINLGIKTEFSPGWVGLIFDRSSWGCRGVLRLAGVIDSDYRDEWQVHLFNSSTNEIKFVAGEKIAQVVFVQHGQIQPTVVSRLSKSTREGGFGSTGR